MTSRSRVGSRRIVLQVVSDEERTGSGGTNLCTFIDGLVADDARQTAIRGHQRGECGGIITRMIPTTRTIVASVFCETAGKISAERTAGAG